MKCPHCGSDLKGKDLCSRCGKKIEPVPEIEVEYKDFKVSEYLEIRQKEHKTSSGTEAGAHEGKRQEIPNKISCEVPVTDEKTSENTRGRTPAEGDLVRRMPAPGSLEGMRLSPFAVTIILLFLAALAGALYLWRFLMR
jgi:DNA-directed RNA polymerase subunit RPC12/RpoP